MRCAVRDAELIDRPGARAAPRSFCVTTIEVHGDVDAGYGAVADEFRRKFSERKELGAACAVVRDGNLVVDLWGGYRDKRRRQPWQRDTLVTVWSTTKGMSAAAMAVAHRRGLFDLDARVATYWPEFAQASKEAITVRQLLEHEPGLALQSGTIATKSSLGAMPVWAEQRAGLARRRRYDRVDRRGCRVDGR